MVSHATDKRRVRALDFVAQLLRFPNFSKQFEAVVQVFVERVLVLHVYVTPYLALRFAKFSSSEKGFDCPKITRLFKSGRSP